MPSIGLGVEGVQYKIICYYHLGKDILKKMMLWFKNEGEDRQI